MIPVAEVRSVPPVSAEVNGSSRCREQAPHVTTSIVFDIETGPLPKDVLDRLFEPYVPAAFDESSVKTGNLRDKAKIDAKIEECRGKHLEAELAKAFQREQEFFGKAALHADTGQVLAIGYYWPENDQDGDGSLISGNYEGEEEVVRSFWQLVVHAIQDRSTLIGHNIHGFDLPFLVRRSWLLGVTVPQSIFSGSGTGNARYFADAFVDTQRRWGLTTGELISLDRLARAMGVGEKNGHGEDFARLWNGSDSEKQEAIEYLQNDLRLTWECARRMGVQ